MSPESEPTDPAEVRRRQARENAEYHHAAAARAAKAEALRTAPMVAAFAEAMRSAGIEPTRLRALLYSGGGSVRTDVVGWYVRRDGRAAVGTDGRWYVTKHRGSGTPLRSAAPPAVGPLAQQLGWQRCLIAPPVEHDHKCCPGQRSCGSASGASSAMPATSR